MEVWHKNLTNNRAGIQGKMVDSISSGAVLQLNTAGLANQSSGGIKLDLNSVPKSKVIVEAPHTEKGKGLKIDIKA